MWGRVVQGERKGLVFRQTTGKANWYPRKRSSEMRPSKSGTPGGAARSPAGPAFVASLPPNFKHKSASKPFL